MRSLLHLGLALLLAGCASAGADPVAQGPRSETGSVRVGWFGGVLDVESTRDVAVITDTVPAPPARLWSELRAVYDTLGVPVNRVRSGARVLGAVGARVRRGSGMARPSTYLSCGSTITGEIADQAEYEIYLTAVTQIGSVPDDPSRSVVSSHVRALARHGSFSGRGGPCSSRGRLEGEIHEHLSLRTAGSRR